MTIFRRKAGEQELKGVGQKVKGVAQEVVGRATGDADLRARGEGNQIGGHVRSRAGEAGRKLADALDPDAPPKRRTR
jgi:uncharacterized protein YjbJ (UPF0337 family)